MALAPGAETLYITDNGTMRLEEAGEGGNTISIIDVRTRQKTGEIPTGKFRRPHGIDIDRATGRVFVSCELPDQLLMIDPEKRAVVRTYGTKGKTAHYVTLSADAKTAYVSNSGSGNVAAVDVASGKVRLIATGARPEGSALARDGKRLYVANRDGHTISIIDTEKERVVGQIPAGKGPVRVAVTPDGRTLVFALYVDRAVEFADAAAGKVTARVPLDGAPVSLTLSPDGKYAMAAAQDQDTVYVLSVAKRKVVETIRTEPGSGPDPVFQLP
jgi:YVTN family beta-propeller protein